MASADTKLIDVLGDKTADALREAFGYITVWELLNHFPRRYIKRGELTPISELHEGEEGTIAAVVSKVKTRPTRTRKGSIAEITVSDGIEEVVLTFFNQAWRQKELKVGTHLLVAGKVGIFNKCKQLAHPTYEIVPEAEKESAAEAFAGAYIPLYPSSSKIPSWKVAKSIEIVLDSVDEIIDPLPESVRARYGYPSLQESIFTLHRPDSLERAEIARERATYDEALLLQLLLTERRSLIEGTQTTARTGKGAGLLDAFDKNLPFELTPGQKTVSAEIEGDLAQSHPMHRLLQGEVGSGKTIVALRAMLRVIDSGGQAALLAPTEVLAAQHFRTISNFLGALGEGQMLGGPVATRAVLVTGSQSSSARKSAVASAQSGEAGIVIGTHALLGESISFADLGLVIVDEQHRFGVEQRDALRAKAKSAPHLLVMTATPIPRTIAMTIFGDLDVSTLRELPLGRQPISTFVVPALEKPAHVERAWQRIREEVALGHQAYVVAPRIASGAPEDADIDFLFGNESNEIASVEELAPTLAQGPLNGLRVAILHGKVRSEDKDETMRAFSDGDIDVLVTTTVIEVGVDVPNATVMVIMDAERFGVSQLHQLRGRVGRGTSPGLCLLVTQSELGSAARARLDAVASTNDGFELSRIDLEQRREGDVLGRTQSGTQSHLRLLRVLRDEELIERARHDAAALFNQLDQNLPLRRSLDKLKTDTAARYIEKS